LIIEKDKAIEDSVLSIAKLMVAAATTAPKSKGFDDTEMKIVVGAGIKRIADQIVESRKTELRSPTFWYMGPDAESVRSSQAIVLIGVYAKKPPLELDCGACGYATCVEFKEAVKRGSTGLCVVKTLDLGIAVCSALVTAAVNLVDNRLMWSVGWEAKKLGLMKADLVLGIPLSATGSNIFVDRYLRYFLERARKENRPIAEVLEEEGIRMGV